MVQSSPDRASREATTPGPVALAGSGEFTAAMDDIDLELLHGRPRRVVFLPTAAGREPEERVRYWVRLGTEHYTRLGVDVEALEVLTRDDAEREDLAERISGAGLVYLSGGNPAYLVDTLNETPVWHAIRSAWLAGAALAGCSAGAIALSGIVRSLRATEAPPRPALGIVPHLAVIPHFDRLMRWAPQIATEAARSVPSGATLVGVDEDTVIVGDNGPGWVVRGRRSAWMLREDAAPLEFPAGQTFELPRAEGLE